MITRITDLSEVNVEPILVESRLQGYRMIDRLIREWRTGENSFSKPNEAFFGYTAKGSVVGLGGINEEPYLGVPEYGRIRHLYVLKAWRRRGVGTEILKRIVEFGLQHYTLITLRTPSDTSADEFYERNGFVRNTSLDTITHVYGQSAASA